MEHIIKEDLKNNDEQDVYLEDSSQNDSQMLFELVYGLVEAFEKIRVKSDK